MTDKTNSITASYFLSPEYKFSSLKDKKFDPRISEHLKRGFSLDSKDFIREWSLGNLLMHNFAADFSAMGNDSFVRGLYAPFNTPICEVTETTYTPSGWPTEKGLYHRIVKVKHRDLPDELEAILQDFTRLPEKHKLKQLKETHNVRMNKTVERVRKELIGSYFH